MKEVIFSFLLAFGLVSCSNGALHSNQTGYSLWCSTGNNVFTLMGISATPIKMLNTYTNVFTFTDTMTGDDMVVSLPCYVISASGKIK